MDRNDFDFFLRKNSQLTTMKVQYTDGLMELHALFKLIEQLEMEQQKLSQQLKEKYHIESENFTVNQHTLEIEEK